MFSEQVKDNKAFSFLYDIQKTILKEYSEEELANNNGSQLNKAKEILKTKMNYYNSRAITTNEGKFFDNLNLAKDAVFDNAETLLDRNNKLEIIINKTNDLKDSSYMVSNFAQKLENKSERKNKYVDFIISLFIIILILIYLVTS